MKRKPQHVRVLEMLQQAGRAGIHSHSMRAAYVANPSERIRFLETQGHQISKTRERLAGDAYGTRYVLLNNTARGTVQPQVPVSLPPAGDPVAPGEPRAANLKAAYGSQPETAHDPAALFEDPPARTYHDREAA